MKKQVVQILFKALQKINANLKEDEIGNLIEVPPKQEMGDFAFPCFPLVKQLKINPHEVALKIREKIGNTPKGFSDVRTQGPYVNFFLDRKVLALDLINEIKTQGDNYGKSDFGKGKTVLIEHTSINPNASPHVGRARNAIIGDSLVRILRFVGFVPEVHYFVNDVSKQIAMLVLAKAEKMKFENMLKEYVKIAAKVKKSKEIEAEVFDLLYKFEHSDPEVSKKFNKITKTCVEGQRKILSELGIEYDIFDYESTYLEQTKKVLVSLQKTGKLFKDEDGRMVLDLKGTSIEGQMKSPVLVLTRSDGTGLYPLRDIAYTLDKMQKSEFNILILGEDQKLYFNQITEALKLLKYPVPQVVHYSFILLSKKGKSRKMSTRRGEVVLLEDFLKAAIKKAAKRSKKKSAAQKIGIGAVKYSIIKNNPNKTINFNLDGMLNFEGDTGPYLLYSYARANSIMKRSLHTGDKIKINKLEEKEIELILKMDEFPLIVEKSYLSLNPSLIAKYSYELAKLFNEFYHSHRILGSNKENFRIVLVHCFMIVLKNSLTLLGINIADKI